MRTINCNKKNQGSTLLLVVVAIAFIGVLSSIAITMTMINLQMKTIDAQSKENFYTAEETMQEIKGSLEEISAQALEETYQEILSNYADLTEYGTCISDHFDFRFLTNLQNILENGVPHGTYNVDVIKSHMCSQAQSNFVSSNGVLICNTLASYAASQPYVKLVNVKISCKDSTTSQLTTIQTDIVIRSPGMTFSTTSAYPEFSKYAIIANQQLCTLSANSDSKIDGDVYAGVDGIISNNGKLSIVGNSLITRGNIEVKNDAILNIGDASKVPDVYAQNICTTNSSINSNPAELTINGNCFVSNDLVLNAVNSKVNMSGNYTGFSYNEKNDASESNKENANFSSAILINGKHCSLNLSGLDSLLLAGRSFISRSDEVGGTSSPGIPMGQSIGVKSNQTMYLVPEKYLINNAHNPMTAAQYNTLCGNAITGAVMSKADIATIDSTLAGYLSNNVATTYRYVMPVSGGSIELVYFYWDFADGKSANNYFDNYIRYEESNHANYDIFKEQMDNYIDMSPTSDKISINPNSIRKSPGSLFRFDTEDGYVKMPDSTTNPFSNPDNPDGTTLNLLNKIANTYVKKQLSLSSGNSTSTELRLVETPDNTIFKSIISHNGSQSLIGEEAAVGIAKGFAVDDFITTAKVKKFAVNVDDTSGDDAFIVIVDNPASGSVFDISTITMGTHGLSPLPTVAGKASLRGIVIATGDVKVSQKFDGLIIAGGKVILSEGEVNSDTKLVRQIIDYAINNYYTTSPEQQFLHYFEQYHWGVGSKNGNSGTVDIATSITYENWKKNMD